MSCRKSLFPAIYHVPKLNETYQNQHPKIMLRHREYHTNVCLSIYKQTLRSVKKDFSQVFTKKTSSQKHLVN